MNDEAKLVVSELAKSYGEPEARPILRDVCFDAGAGETVGIVGPSGSGKSTLLNLIGSLDRPTSGSIRVGETEVTALEGPALARFRATEVGFVFQDHHLLPQLTALENALLPARAAGKDASAAERAAALLERVGVAHRAGGFPAQLSGGERQRVAIARALINRPRLLLCDEPTGNLDRQTGSAVVDLLLELAEREGVTVLMVTHNAEHAGRMARRLELRDGALVPLEGNPA